MKVSDFFSSVLPFNKKITGNVRLRNNIFT